MRQLEFIVLLGGADDAARQANIEEDIKRKITVILPPEAPLSTHPRSALFAPGADAESLAGLP
jgi:hypothetical protein